jgi:hypothetical protein
MPKGGAWRCRVRPGLDGLSCLMTLRWSRRIGALGQTSGAESPDPYACGCCCASCLPRKHGIVPDSGCNGIYAVLR